MIRRLWSSANLVLALLVALPMACLAQAPMATTASGLVRGLAVNGIDALRYSLCGAADWRPARSQAAVR